MLRSSSHLTLSHLLPDNPVVIIALFATNIFFNIAANSSFKLSATAPTWRDFLVWQIIGNLAGFVMVLTLTGLLPLQPFRPAAGRRLRVLRFGLLSRHQ